MDTTRDQLSNIQFGLAWNWEYDQDFVHLIDQACFQAGISCYLVGIHNLAETHREVANSTRRFTLFLDRASDTDDRFLQFHYLLQDHGTQFINAHHHYKRSIDKANIHGELIARGLQVPPTVILPPHESEPQFDPRLIERLSKPLVVKPSKGGGGSGVLVGAIHPEEVMKTRSKFVSQRFLVQQQIEPQVLGNHRAWYRVYYVCGEIIPCWWDDQTHRYTTFNSADQNLVNVDEITRIVQIIAEVSQLDFFSTEIALDKEGRYIVVDYVNDPCDMRFQSKCFDGVPNAIVHAIADRITNHIKQHSHSIPMLV